MSRDIFNNSLPQKMKNCSDSIINFHHELNQKTSQLVTMQKGVKLPC